jgi:predicted nucleic-acid-binding protein
VIAFDSNPLLRLLLGDEVEQQAAVLEIMARCRTDEERIFLGSAVLCETTWVLRSSYSVPREGIARALRRILADPLFVVERREEVEAAVARFEEGRGDFSDYLIGETARATGARTTFTFDRTLRRETGFTLA